MSSQQGQPTVGFNALRPATWGSLKLIPQALKSKLTGAKGADDHGRVPLAGKENAMHQPAPPAAPPKIADISHLQSIGPRRNISQRYALQPNLNVARPTQAPGLNGLLLPAATSQTVQSQASQQQRPSTPSSPTLRGRMPLGFAQTNPIYSAQPTIATRLPTPVRINSTANAASSSSGIAPVIPRPPSPSRSHASTGPPAKSLMPGSAGSSPIFSSNSNGGFALPIPPPLLPNKAAPWAPGPAGHSQPLQQRSQNQQHAASVPAAAPRPTAPTQERSILASVQLPSQQPRAAVPAATTVSGAIATAPAVNVAQCQPAAAPVSPVAVNAPAIQAALQQALQAAMERQPEMFQADNFERLFDSMMHPGTASKLDGPLPHELPEDIRNSDKWHTHCRDWNSHNKPALPYVVPEQQHQQQATANTPAAATNAVNQGATAPVAGAGTPEAATVASTIDSDQHAVANAAANVTAATAATSPQQAQSTLAPAASSQVAVATTAAITPRSTWQDFTELAEAVVAAPSPAAEAAAAPAMRKATGLRVVVDGLDLADIVPTAAEASITPTPPRSSARAPSTVTNTPTPGPRTPGGGAYSIASTAATTPAAGGAHTAATTPTSGGGGAWLASADPFGDSAFPAAEAMTTSAAASCTSYQGSNAAAFPNEAAAAAAVTATTDPEADFILSLPPPPREYAHNERSMSVPGLAPSNQGQELLQVPSAPPSNSTLVQPTASASASVVPTGTWSPDFSPIATSAARPPAAAAPAAGSAVRPPSPVTLLHTVPRDAPTPIPAFFSSGASAAAASGPAALAAAVAAAANPSKVAARDPEGPSTSTAPPPPDPLKEIVVGIEKLSTLKQNILAEDKEVDVASITQMIQLKMAVEQLLKRTNTAAQAVVSAVTPASNQLAAAATPASAEQHSGTPKKQSRAAGFGAFLKSVFSPKSSSASKSQAAAAAMVAAATPTPVPAPAPSSVSTRMFGANAASILNAGGAAAAPVAAVPASPVTQRTGSAVGFLGARPSSASALPRRVASPSPADRSRYATLHQKAAARLAEAAAEPAGARSILAATGASVAAPSSHQQQLPFNQPRGDLLRRYEEKIAVHRTQLDATKSQLDEALRKLNDMQTEFDELLLCLGMESAKNQALCEAMRAAGLDPEPILAAIEEQWLSGAGGGQ